MSLKIKVDPIACTAHGMCAELLPERITLDDWGYPLIDGRPVPPGLEQLARKAAGACPTLALKLQIIEERAEADVQSATATRRPPASRQRRS
jgi:ferredoxin